MIHSPHDRLPLVVPKALKPPRAELHVANRVPDVTMTQIRLNQPQVGAAFRQVVATGVPEAVWVNVQQSEASTFGNPVQHQLDSPCGEWPATFRAENKIPGLWSFPLQAPERPNLHPAKLVITGVATLRTLHVEDSGIQVELVPVGREAFLNSQAMREQHKYQSGIPVAVAALTCSLYKLGDLIGQKMLPAAWAPARTLLKTTSLNQAVGMKEPQRADRNPEWFSKLTAT